MVQSLGFEPNSKFRDCDTEKRKSWRNSGKVQKTYRINKQTWPIWHRDEIGKTGSSSRSPVLISDSDTPTLKSTRSAKTGPKETKSHAKSR